MTEPLVSVLIDTYNYGHFIGEAIDSVLGQDFPMERVEIVVVDDGSTDGTRELVQRKYGSKVRYVYKGNGGQASAFNAGFAEMRGEIVAFLDADDWWAEGKLKRVVDALEANPEIAAVGHGYYKFREDTQEASACLPGTSGTLSIATPKGMGAALTAWGFLVTSALTVRRKVIEWIRPLPEEMVFMADTAVQAAGILMGAMILDEPLLYYRHHSQNLYVVDGENREKLRRRYEMTELVYRRVYEMLVARRVARETVGDLIVPNWVAVSRSRLRTFGGTPLETFQTEMRAFQVDFKKPSFAYRLFKYGVTGAPMLLLPPRVFYRMRDWYAKENLGRLRDRLVKPT